MKTKNVSVYVENGYTDRLDYLTSIADDFGLPLYAVKEIASLLGETEDFDGLVTTLEDMADSGDFEGCDE